MWRACGRNLLECLCVLEELTRTLARFVPSPSYKLSMAAGAPVLAIDGQALGGPQGKIGDKDAADALVLALETKWGWGPEVFKFLRIELEVETLHDFVAASETGTS